MDHNIKNLIDSCKSQFSFSWNHNSDIEFCFVMSQSQYKQMLSIDSELTKFEQENMYICKKKRYASMRQIPK